MAGKIVADTLEHSTAGSVSTQYVVEGSAKVLEKHDASHTIDNSTNVSTLTDNGGGDTTVNYTNSTANIHQYVVAGTGNNSTQNRLIQNVAAQTHTTSSHRYKVGNGSLNATDAAVNNSVLYGDLA